MRGKSSPVLLLACVALATAAFPAHAHAGEEPPTPTPETPSGVEAPLPFATDDSEIEELWREGHRLELAGRFRESARVYEAVAARLPAESHVYWRIARDYYQYGKALPLEERDERIESFELVQDWAGRGIEVDPSCAECNLYEFVGLSRLATTRGILSSARHAGEMAALLDRAFELGPTHVDNDWNSELGNLYYAAGVFYRSVPKSSMLSWAIGVRGDRARSLDYLRRANAITDRRIDYQIELGVALLCAGTESHDEAMLAEGSEILRRIPSLPDLQASDALDREAAPLLIAHPERACEFSREAIDALRD